MFLTPSLIHVSLSVFSAHLSTSVQLRSFEVSDYPQAWRLVISCLICLHPFMWPVLEATCAYFFNHFTHSAPAKLSTSPLSAREIHRKPVGLDTEVLVKNHHKKPHYLFIFKRNPNWLSQIWTPGAEQGEWKHVSDPAEQIEIHFNHNPLLKAVLRAIFYEGLRYIGGIRGLMPNAVGKLEEVKGNEKSEIASASPAATLGNQQLPEILILMKSWEESSSLTLTFLNCSVSSCGFTWMCNCGTVSRGQALLSVVKILVCSDGAKYEYIIRIEHVLYKSYKSRYKQGDVQ